MKYLIITVIAVAIIISIFAAGYQNNRPYNQILGGESIAPGDTGYVDYYLADYDSLNWTLVSHAHGVEWFAFSSIVNYSGAGWDTINCPIDYGSLQVLTTDADSIYLWPNDTSATPLITSNSYKRLINNDLSRLIIRTFSSCTIEYHFEK